MQRITRNQVWGIRYQPAEKNRKHEHDQPDTIARQAHPVQRTILFKESEKSLFYIVETGLAHDGNGLYNEQLGDADGQPTRDDGFPF